MKDLVDTSFDMTIKQPVGIATLCKVPISKKRFLLSGILR